MKGKLVDTFLSLAATACVGAIIFLIHVLFISPRKLFNEKAAELQAATNRLRVGEQENQELRDSSRPKLVGEIIQLGASASASETPGGTNFATTFFPVIATISVKNLGAPSIAEGFHLFLILTNGTRIAATTTMIPEKGIVFRDWLSVYPQDSIHVKCAETPIPKGAKMIGHSVYFVDGKIDDLWKRGTIVEIHFRDILETNYVITSLPFTGDKKEGELLYFPGLIRPTKMAP